MQTITNLDHNFINQYVLLNNNVYILKRIEPITYLFQSHDTNHHISRQRILNEQNLFTMN